MLCPTTSIILTIILTRNIFLPCPPDSLAGFTPDCGRRHIYVNGKKEKGKKFLSFKKASITNAQKHVGILKDTYNDGTKDTLVPFPLNAPLGAHDWRENGWGYRIFKKVRGVRRYDLPSVILLVLPRVTSC